MSYYQQPSGYAPYANPPQQAGYGGAPPVNNYGAPAAQGVYGAPPSQPSYGAHQQPHYGAPPQQAYGAPQAYGAANSQGSYGAPPQAPYGGYNAPPAGAGHASSFYGNSPAPSAALPHGVSAHTTYGQPAAPPMPAYGAPQQSYSFNPNAPVYFLRTTIPPPPPAQPVQAHTIGYNPQPDIEKLRKATKGFGTDEKALIEVLTRVDPWQVDVLSKGFEGASGKSLRRVLEKETSGWLEYGLVLLSLGPLMGDLHLLNRACVGAGTHEDLLNELLLGRTNQEIHLLKEGYQRAYGKDLVSVVRGELSMKTERMFVMALAGTRDENPHVNHAAVQQDCQALHNAGSGRLGTDEITICGILLQRSDAHLTALAQAYQQRYRTPLSKAIQSEFSGHMRDGLYYIARGVETIQAIERDVELLYDAMAGMGTKDERLVYRVVRGHWCRPRWEDVKRAYKAKYGKSLSSAVKGETSGKYERMLVAMCE
ncbi:hypothetical protein NliqN6_2585 [Naganishia liquefaciens]|uniref:Annexin n=1 Tax=Naganishia liquefaciens TaxID=104408 RepID=A0A8H3YEE5_9TREE|nr:hypothetical protein NliqN6_2585 [Naganishia liquefaciens]